MKKALVVGMVIIMSVMSGCVIKTTPMQNIQNEVKSEVDEMKNEVNETVKKITDGKVDTSKFIGPEKAKSIALEKAELKAGDVVFERAELDYDDGVWQYEIEFRKGTVEYEADIKADDGTILKWDMDRD